MDSLRLMTANLLNGKADPARFASMLDEWRPDVLVAQELGMNMVDVVATRFGWHDLVPDHDHQGRGVASAIEAQFGCLPLSWRWIAWARLDLGGKPLVVATTHMRNPIAFPWGTSLRLRREQTAGVFAWADALPEPGALVVAGDMNASPAWPAYRRLAARWPDLVAGEARRSGRRPEPTWAWRPGWPRLLRIDHVLGTGVEASQCWVEPIPGSDHAAVIVELRWA